MITIERVSESIRIASNRAMIDKSDRKRIMWLRTVKSYLETNPEEEYCTKKLHELEAHVMRICEQEDKYARGNKKSEYLKVNRVPEMKEQIKVLKYILNK